ncbi:hypothetical protein F5141DRAFT_1063648 [Pisolithus sp. B1]|nr:hypothetical protein F5141DRAFT_1063648 [Pisolithus sp. B1]
MTVLELQVPSQTSVEARAQTPRVVTPQLMTSRAMTPREKMPKAITPRAQSPRGQTPAPTAKGKSVAIKFPSHHSSDLEGSPAPSELSLSSLESELGESDKISKLSGYNLEEQLSWGDDSFKCLKDCKALDTAIAEFPDLGTFENCWPILDLVQMHLKYLSSRAWQKKRIAYSEVAKHEKRMWDRSPISKSPGPLKK